jgi:hypothetical protein
MPRLGIVPYLVQQIAPFRVERRVAFIAFRGLKGAIASWGSRYSIGNRRGL